MVISRFVKSGRGVISALFALLIAIIIMTVVLILAESIGLRSQVTERDCVNNDWEREHIRQLALDGIDKAFQNHVETLYEIWIKDPSDQPRRASAGMALNISAYNRARANTIKWDAPHCK